MLSTSNHNDMKQHYVFIAKGRTQALSDRHAWFNSTVPSFCMQSQVSTCRHMHAQEEEELTNSPVLLL